MTKKAIRMVRAVGCISGSIAVLALLHPPGSRGFVSVAEAQSQAAPTDPCSSDESRQFDFWVGDWVVRSSEGQVVGSNLVEKTLNDCVVMENWEGADGSIGKSFNMFYAADGKWHQTWVDGNGRRLDLSGGWKKGKMTLTGTTPGDGGKTVHHEISWTPQSGGDVRQAWRISRDRGKTWNEIFVGIYSRRAGG